MVEVLGADEAKKLSPEEAFQKLSSSPQGLSSPEVQARLEQFGRNELVEKKVNPIWKFLSYFWGPIAWMIEVAAALSGILRHWESFVVILAFLFINGIVGFWQERKADIAIELLKKRLALLARARRDRKWQSVDAPTLVPGDVVRLRSGDVVPADLKLVEGDFMQADESALTGESLPVDKHIGDIAYSGANIKQGEMTGLVAATGMQTYFGETARLVEEARTVSHFQRAVVRIGDYLIVLAVVLVAIMLAVTILIYGSGVMQALGFSLVLTVAAIPVALPPVLSVTMAVGVMALAAREAIVSKLVAVEEMAGVDILCADKTGTITQNKLTMEKAAEFGDFTEHDAALAATLSSREEDQDPIDNAILAKTRPRLGEELKGYKVVKYKPFDPVSKRTEATVEDPRGRQFKVSKGAPQVILDLAADKEAVRGKVDEVVEEFGARGYRSLGVARTDEQGKWRYVGMVPLMDPPREDSAETIETAQAMGVDVKMVTGDHAVIAAEIAGRVHLGTNIQSAAAFLDKPDAEAAAIVEKADGFAQVFPEHKYRIVELLQSRDHIVGMTGDGVNDAPALKKADVGIAVAGATDAAKSAAHIVFTRPGLSTIIDAIKESRKIFQRMTSYSIYRITETIRVLFFVASAIIFLDIYPVTAIMLVMLVIFNDAPIMTIAYDNVRYGDKPEVWDMRIILGLATLIGFMGVFESFGVLFLGLLYFELGPAELQSFLWLKLVVSGHLTIFLTRVRGPFYSLRPGRSLFWSAVGTKAIATVFIIYAGWFPRLSWTLAGVIWGEALLVFVIIDLLKVRLFRLLAEMEAAEARREIPVLEGLYSRIPLIHRWRDKWA